jgi:hypothetical protein
MKLPFAQELMKRRLVQACPWSYLVPGQAGRSPERE